MGEHVPASIKFGGKLSRTLANELVDLVNAEGLDPDWGNSGDITIEDLDKDLGHNEVNYGNLDTLESFAQENGLAFVAWFDAGGDWTQGFHKQDIDGRYEELSGATANPVFSAKEIRALGPEAVLALADWAVADLPALEIVDDDQV